MKLHPLILATLCAVSVFARAEISPISIRVEQTTGVDREKFKKTQEKALKIFVTNGSSADINNLTVKYFFFGHSLKDHEAEILEKGERTASVKARMTETVETPVAKASSTEAHSEAKKGKGQNAKKGSQAGKKVAASGEKLTGYGVQVFEGGKLLADYFSEPSLREKAAGGDRK